MEPLVVGSAEESIDAVQAGVDYTEEVVGDGDTTVSFEDQLDAAGDALGVGAELAQDHTASLPWKCEDCDYEGKKALHVSQDGVCRFLKNEMWCCLGYTMDCRNCVFETTDEQESESHHAIPHRNMCSHAIEYCSTEIAFACDRCDERCESTKELREHVEQHHHG